MSIRDYNKKYVIVNGTTNERIVVPKTNHAMSCLQDYDVDFALLVDYLKDELSQCDSVTIFKSYMKDD